MLRSKAPSTCEELGDDYTMVGIVNEHFVGLEVEEIDPVQPSLANTITSMRNKGVKVIYFLLLNVTFANSILNTLTLHNTCVLYKFVFCLNKKWVNLKELLKS